MERSVVQIFRTWSYRCHQKLKEASKTLPCQSSSGERSISANTFTTHSGSSGPRENISFPQRHEVTRAGIPCCLWLPGTVHFLSLQKWSLLNWAVWCLRTESMKQQCLHHFGIQPWPSMIKTVFCTTRNTILLNWEVDTQVADWAVAMCLDCKQGRSPEKSSRISL